MVFYFIQSCTINFRGHNLDTFSFSFFMKFKMLDFLFKGRKKKKKDF